MADTGILDGWGGGLGPGSHKGRPVGIFKLEKKPWAGES